MVGIMMIAVGLANIKNVNQLYWECPKLAIVCYSLVAWSQACMMLYLFS